MTQSMIIWPREILRRSWSTANTLCFGIAWTSEERAGYLSLSYSQLEWLSSWPKCIWRSIQMKSNRVRKSPTKSWMGRVFPTSMECSHSAPGSGGPDGTSEHSSIQFGWVCQDMSSRWWALIQISWLSTQFTSCIASFGFWEIITFSFLWDKCSERERRLQR